MRSSYLIAAILLHAGFVGFAAEKPGFPYEAIVDVEDGDNVWSGPDAKKYYPTARLNRGERVKVHRHDYGGWCMIAPPEGSYSWVNEKYVKRDGAERGVITSNRVFVHVGSELNPDDFLTLQVELSKGDAVEILGEKSFSFPDESPRTMLKISPPRGEWRWIMRKSIVPVDALRSTPFPDEISTPKKRGPIANSNPESTTRPISTGTNSPDNQAELPVDAAGIDQGIDLKTGRQKMYDIDREFREMVKEDPPTWDLDSLEEKYSQLDSDVGQAALTTEINRRLDSVKRHRKTQQEYIEFFKLTSETKERDAQLLQLQTRPTAQPQPAGQLPPAANPLANPNPSPNPTPLAQPLPASAPNPNSTTLTSPSTAPAGAAAPAFDGAGIVQKLATSFPGGPQYVLISPEGRMLCILQPTAGVDLNRYNGRTMGIVGQRFHRDDWNADVINVRGLQPVQLRPKNGN